MKRKNVMLVTFTLSTVLFLGGCSASSNVSENKETLTTNVSEVAPTEEKHEHNYAETITVEATCETDGEATYTCECGDTYTEVVPAMGHSFTNYVSNNDATYTADGTETAKCDNCDATDTRTAEGSMLTYTYTDMDATKYAKSAVNVRNMPTTDGEKLGGLSTNNEVKVTGQCNETGWYRIEYNGNVAYVSDSYLVDNKVETQTASTQSASDSSASQSNGSTATETSSQTKPTASSYAEACAVASSLGFTPWQVHNEGGENVWCYVIINHGGTNLGGESAQHDADYDNAQQAVRDTIAANGGSITTYGKIGERTYIYRPDGGYGWSVAKFGKID